MSEQQVITLSPGRIGALEELKLEREQAVRQGSEETRAAILHELALIQLLIKDAQSGGRVTIDLESAKRRIAATFDMDRVNHSMLQDAFAVVSAVDSDDWKPAEPLLDAETPKTANIRTRPSLNALHSLDPETRDIPPSVPSFEDRETRVLPSSESILPPYRTKPFIVEQLPSRHIPTEKELRESLAKREFPWIRKLYDLFR